MKKILIIILLLLLVGCEKDKNVIYDFAGDKEAVNTEYQTSITKLSRDLLEVVYTDQKNINISPMSIHMILSLLSQGGVGDTKTEIDQMLYINSFDDETIQDENRKIFKNSYIKNDDSELMIANSIWLTERFKFEEAYQTMAKEKYFAQIYTVDFTKSKTNDLINNWALDHTNDRIALEFEGSEDTAAVLLNAVYLIDLWQLPFEEKLTRDLDFTLSNGTVIKVPTMRQFLADYPYYETDEFLKVTFDLEQVGKVEIILPKEDYTVKDLLNDSVFEKALSNEFTDTIDIQVRLPKGKIEATYELNDILKELGMKAAYENADFSLITKSPIAVTSVVHKTFFAFDEKKVEAAAVTEVVTEETAAEIVEELYFYVDRPFMYTIKSTDGTLLFLGVMNNPVEE